MRFFKRLSVTTVALACALSTSMFNSDTAVAAGTELCVDAASGLQIRLKPANSSKVVATVEDGECGVWLRSPSRKSGSFVAVNYEGKSGWAPSKLLIASESQAATPSEPAPKALFPRDGEKCWLTGSADEIYNEKGKRLYCISGQYSLVFREPRAGDECVFAVLDKGLACTQGRLNSSSSSNVVANSEASTASAKPLAAQLRICGKTANPQINSAIDREQVLLSGGPCPVSHPFDLAGWREVTCFSQGGNSRNTFVVGPTQDCRSSGYDGEVGKDSFAVSSNTASPVANVVAAAPTPSTTYRISASDQSRLDRYAAALTALSNHMYKYYPSYAWPLKGSCSNDRVATARDAWLDSTLWNFIKKGYTVREVETDFLRVCSDVLAASAR
jgi:uncharacterized protein YgiM (DUF1202 family)